MAGALIMPADGGYSPRILRTAHFIDDHGESWPHGSPELARALRTRLRGHALDDYLLRQVGFALVRQTSALVECVFDEEAVSPVTLVGVLYLVGEINDRPIAVRSPAEPIRIDRLHDRRSAISLISAIIETKRQRPRFERRPCVIEKTAFAQLWRAGREIIAAPIDDPTRLRLLETLYAGNFTLNQLNEDDGRFRISAIGGGIARYDPGFAARGVGATYHTLSDPDYGAWVSDTFDEFATLNREAAEVVDARIEVPGKPQCNLSYTRLVLPVSCRSRRYLLVATDVA